MKKFACLLLAFTLFFSSSQGTIVEGAEGKINDWPLMEKAIQYENEKSYDKAIYYFEELVKLYSNYTTIYAYENGGHYARRAGDYYAGLYNNKIFDSEKATLYYEKAYNFYLKFADLSGSTSNNWAFVQVKKKLDDIKTTVDLYVETDLSSAKAMSRPLAKHEPKSGMLLGIYGEGNPALIRDYVVDPSMVNQVYGKHGSLLYYNVYSNMRFPTGPAEKMKAQKGSLQIHMQPMKGLDEVTDSEHLRSFAKAAKASGIPIFLRFAGEMNGDWVEWGMQPQKYIEKFKLVHDIMEQEAPNVAMVWAPNFFPWDNMAEYYPGDAYVDWVGVSCYTTLNYEMSNKETKLKSNPIDLLQYIVKDYGQRKPIMIVEGAISYYAVNEPTIDYTKWAENNLHRFYSYIPLVYPEIKAMYYYDAPGVNGGEKYILSTNSVLKNAYKDIIGDSYYLKDMETQIPFKYEKVASSLPKSKVNLASYVKSYDPIISKVEYYVDNQLVQTLTSIPYKLSYDFSTKAGGSTKITIKAYNSENKMIANKDFTLNLTQPPIKVLYNNKQLSFTQSPVIKSGRTLVPMRSIFEAFGMEVDYEKDTKKVTAKNDSHEIILTIGSNKAYVNGKEELLDVPSELVNNTTMVPLRFIGQSVGFNVEYVNTSRTVLITN